MHTRCYGIPDDAPVPESFVCDACTAAGHVAQPHHAHPEGAAAAAPEAPEAPEPHA